MATAVIVDAVRTAGGKRNGKLSGWHPADLAAETLKALVERNGLDPGLVDDVIMGCVMQVGDQAVNIGRNAVLAAGFPESVPATTVDRQCGSSQQSAHFAAQGVIAGAYDIVVAAGVEVMSLVRWARRWATARSASRSARPVGARYADVGGLVPQGISAELIADKWGLSREDLDAFGARSPAAGRAGHRRGPLRAARSSRSSRSGSTRRPARSSSPTRSSPPTRASARARPSRRWPTLKPAFKPDGKVTAGNSSQITDGAAAVLIMSEEKANAARPHPAGPLRHLRPRRRRPGHHAHRPDPAPRRRCSSRPSSRIDDIDLIEINEAFASVVLAWEKELHPDMARSTSTAAPSPSVTRSAARAPSSWPRCSTSSSAPAAATACRRCARAAAWPTPPSSNASG